MPDLASIITAIQAGGLVTFSLVAVFGFVKGWWVPGYLYDREVARSEKLNDQVDQNTRAFAEATSAYSSSLDRLTDEVRSRDRVR